jgi:hypothetical protein
MRPPGRAGDFTPTGYARILEQALIRRYQISSFRDYDPGRHPALILRHDIDHTLRCARLISNLESGLGVSSTYFVQVASDFYNLLSGESRSIVRHLVDNGHEIGLHYDSRRYSASDGATQLRLDTNVLEDLTGQKVVSASQHIPIDSPMLRIDDFFENDAYSSAFTEEPFTYISDSLMAWRVHHPQDIIESGRSLQLLTHPMCWARPTSDIGHALTRAQQEEAEFLRRSYEQTQAYYESLLAQRGELDTRFKRRRSANN